MTGPTEIPGNGAEASSGLAVITTPEGVRLNGMTDPAILLNLATVKTFRGEPLEPLQAKMREDQWIRPDQTLPEVWASNTVALKKLNSEHNLELTHQDLGDFLREFETVDGEKGVHEINGQRFGYEVETYRGTTSPFGEPEGSNKFYTITNLQSGARIRYSGIRPTMIRKYGFYGDEGTPNYIPPLQIAEVAGFIPPPADDPVVTLLQDRNAAVTITNRDQLTRANNLHTLDVDPELDVDVLSGEHFRLAPDGIAMVLDIADTFQRTEERERIAERIDTNHVTPGPYRMERYQLLTNTIPSDFPQLEEAALQGISEIHLIESSYDIDRLVTTALNGTQTRDGQEAPHKSYYERLLKKIARDEVDIIRLFKAVPRSNLLAELDAQLPTFKSDIIDLFAQIGMVDKNNFDPTLEQLVTSRLMQIYETTVAQATDAVRGIGQVTEATPDDIKALIKTMAIVYTDPTHEFTADEREIMDRLQVDPTLVPYADKVAKQFSRSSAVNIMQNIYNGRAEKVREKETLMGRLPDNLDATARAAIEHIIDSQQSLREPQPGRIDLAQFAFNIAAQAERLQATNTDPEMQFKVTEAGVIDAYLEVLAPEFSDLFLHPLFEKTISHNALGVRITMNQAEFADLPQVLVRDDAERFYPKVVIGDDYYLINTYRHTIYKNPQPNRTVQKVDALSERDGIVDPLVKHDQSIYLTIYEQ